MNHPQHRFARFFLHPQTLFMDYTALTLAEIFKTRELTGRLMPVVAFIRQHNPHDFFITIRRVIKRVVGSTAFGKHPGEVAVSPDQVNDLLMVFGLVQCIHQLWQQDLYKELMHSTIPSGLYGGYHEMEAYAWMATEYMRLFIDRSPAATLDHLWKVANHCNEWNHPIIEEGWQSFTACATNLHELLFLCCDKNDMYI